MGGGLLQLVAYGAQDVYLTGNPQITFFKVVYRRHTNFAMEAIQQTFSGTPNFGQTVYCQISRNGDLIHRTYLEVKVPKIDTFVYEPLNTGGTPRYVNYLGLKLIKQVTIEIGGQQIDKHYSDWLYIWNELSLPYGKKHGWNTMVGADGDNTSSVAPTGFSATNDATDGSIKTLFVPLEFWFCRNIGLALPLIALQYHEVKIKIDFEDLSNCIWGTNSTDDSVTAPIKSAFKAILWVDYIFLDTDERRRFAQLSHEYLIEQLQFTGQENISVGPNRIKLNFNHPVKELIWVSKTVDISGKKQHWYNYTSDHSANYSIPYDPTKLESYQYGSREPDGREIFDVMRGAIDNTDIARIINNVTPIAGNPFTDGLLQLNGNDRFAVRNGSYFNYVQPYQHHTNIPLNKGINVYSFALKPEEHQPSGTLNMSRIDTAVLSLTYALPTGETNPGTLNVYAVNYNVLRILSGMGGLAYSN
jgi:hypothetical protein